MSKKKPPAKKPSPPPKKPPTKPAPGDDVDPFGDAAEVKKPAPKPEPPKPAPAVISTTEVKLTDKEWSTAKTGPVPYGRTEQHYHGLVNTTIGLRQNLCNIRRAFITYQPQPEALVLATYDRWLDEVHEFENTLVDTARRLYPNYTPPRDHRPRGEGVR